MRFSRLLSALLIALIFLPFSASAFEDVTSESPYFYGIEYLRRSKVYPDTKKFNPDKEITKAEFIKYLVKMNDPDFNASKEVIQMQFTDVPKNSPYAPYIDEALDMGILSDRLKQIQPYSKLNVADAIELLFHSKSIPIPRRFVGQIPYTDLAKNQKHAPMIMRALEFQLVAPAGKDYFGAYRKVTRGQAAQMIYRMEVLNIASPEFNGTEKPETGNAVKDYRLHKIMATWELINKNYLKRDELDQEKLSEAAIRGMMDTLNDPHSVYLDPTQNQSFSDNLDGEIEGIGAMVGLNEKNELTVIAPLSGSPALKAGVRAGDIIRKVNGVDIKDKPLMEAVSLIKGPRGSEVTLTLDREGVSMELKVTRDVILLKALESKTIENGSIMYIKLNEFSQPAAQEFSAVTKAIIADPAIKGIVLDLRNNPGGLLDSAVGILNQFIPKDSPVVTIQYSFFSYTQLATGDGPLFKYPVAVIVNKGSASASEILAGALQDYEIGTVVGQTSYGKGTVQEINHFRDNSSLKLTIAEWLTPKKRSIQGVGVVPDIQVALQEGASSDMELQQAISVIRERRGN